MNLFGHKKPAAPAAESAPPAPPPDLPAGANAGVWLRVANSSGSMKTLLLEGSGIGFEMAAGQTYYVRCDPAQGYPGIEVTDEDVIVSTADAVARGDGEMLFDALDG